MLVVSSDGVVRWQGYPLDEADRLTPQIVRSVIESDPGVMARRAREAAAEAAEGAAEERTARR